MEEKKEEELKEELKVEKKSKEQIELEETTDRLKRVMAEFENYKKRSSKERDILYNSLVADIVSKFLPVVDNLEKAVENKCKDENFKQGIELILKQIKEIFKNLGVEEIETVGKTFDPEVHEAVSSVVDENLGEKEI